MELKIGDRVRRTTLSKKFGPKGIYEDTVVGFNDDGSVVYLKDSFWQSVKEVEKVRDFPEKPKSYEFYRREMIKWLDAEIEGIMGFMGEDYSEEPVKVYMQVSELLKKLKV